MKEVRIGMIGCGNVGIMQSRAMEKLQNARLVAVADQNRLLAQEMADRCGCRAFADYRELFQGERVDLVSICLPPALHCQVALEAAQEGVHVLVEKPLEVSVKQANRMIQGCREHGVKLGVISQHRFDPEIRTVKQLLDRGVLGKPLLGSARVLWYRSPEYYGERGGWRATRENQGGVLMSQAIHYIDLLQYLMGRVREVSALCGTLLHDIEVEDTGLAHLRFEGGGIGSIEGTTIAYPGLHSELNLHTQQASLCIRNDRLELYGHKSGTIPELEELLKNRRDSAKGAGNPMAVDVSSHARQFQDMVDAILERRAPAVTGEEGREPVAIIQAIHRSADTGRWTAVER